ncbi:hypothetical protein BpHYR1_000571 [Brachionus plicatilis]|uniref:Uncharacterized protein n=1 Tax=Brachionus plicatilis TaxID=10195 RepID=A0A3M7T4Q9_BRAPC|nr:hypothetical protein BpHYR1_000571 [Brachionus plicatilis]
MNAHSRSRNSSTSESESTTDVSCADSMPAPINAAPVHHQQRFILTPNMYFQDAVYRTFSYAPPPPPSVIKNFAPILPPEMQRATISTCMKPQADCSSYRYRYYAPAGPVAASRLVKGEAAPKRFAPIEQSMSFQNFGARLQYPANQSFDSSYRNISFEPMNYESSRHLEKFNRPVSNLWQMAGSSANATNSSQKFLNQYAMNEALGPNGATGYHNSNNNNYFQDKNLLSHKSAKLRNSFKLKALAIIGLVLVVVISIAVILSVVITRSAMASSTSLPMQDGNQKRLLNSSRFNEDNSTDSDTIVVGVDISLNVTSGKTFFFDNSTQSNSSLVAAAARLLFSQFNSTSTSSNIGSQIIQKFKHLDTSNATIYDPELLDMLSNYSNHSNYSNATMNDTRVTLN